MRVDGSKYQSKTESEEDSDEASMLSSEKQASNRKMAMSTPLEKLAAVIDIQRNIKVCYLSMRSACRASKLHHKQFISWKWDIVVMQAKRNKKTKSMCIWLSSILHPKIQHSRHTKK